MKCLRVVSLSVLLGGLATSAFASYDLMYLPDTSGDRVHRFDPVTRAYLGSFNTFSGVSKVAVTPSGQKVAVQASIINEYNPSNGSLIGSLNISQSRGIAYIDDTNLRYVSPSLIVKTTPSGSLVTFSPLAGLTPLRALDLPNGNVFVVHENVAGDLVAGLYTSTGTAVGSTITVALAASVGATAAVGSLSFAATNLTTDPIFFTYRGNAGLRLGRVGINSTFSSLTAQSGLNLAGYTIAGANSSHNVMAGHAGMHWIVGSDATNPLLTRITGIMASSVASVQEMTSYTTNAFSVPAGIEWSGGNVVAPEPGSLLALGIGAFLIARRRK